MKQLYPIRKANYTDQEKMHIANSLLDFLEGLEEDEELDGADLAERVREFVAYINTY